MSVALQTSPVDTQTIPTTCCTSDREVTSARKTTVLSLEADVALAIVVFVCVACFFVYEYEEMFNSCLLMTLSFTMLQRNKLR